MKYIKIFFALDFLACGFFGITQYISTTEIANLFASIFCFICAFLLFRSVYKKNSTKTITTSVNPALELKTQISPSSEENSAETFSVEQTNIINSASATKKLETTQKMLNDSLNQLNKAASSGNILKATVRQNGVPSASPESGVSYIEDDKMIARADGKEITDNEVSYLVQAGQEEAISKWKIQELTRLISESYRIMQTTDNPETLCNRYNFIVEKVNELAFIKQKGLFDKNTFNQYSALISDDNFYNLIIICYQKYVVKAKSELKTQNGITNRINKFWSIIYHNVNTEFYNEKIKKGNMNR